MSGGSFDYLCDSQDLEDLLGKQYSLNEMAEALALLDEKEYPGAAAAAEMTFRQIRLIQVWQAQTRATIGVLEDVWQAVEWTRSGDYGSDSIKDALKELLEPKE